MALPSWPCEPVWRGVVASTMDEARLLAGAKAPHGTTVVAEQQTAGRGRSGHSWLSPAGAGLYATTLLYPPASDCLASVSLALGLACAEALRALGAQVQLKWPNDLLFAGGKLGGLLLQQEAPSSPAGGCLLFGFGINLAPLAPHARLAQEPGRSPLPRADLLTALGGRVVARTSLVRALLRACETAYNTWCAEGIDAQICRRFDALHALHGQPVTGSRHGGGAVVGTVVGLQPCGGLLLRTASGPALVQAGAVQGVRLQAPETQAG